jgi:hypothetical protein
MVGEATGWGPDTGASVGDKSRPSERGLAHRSAESKASAKSVAYIWRKSPTFCAWVLRQEFVEESSTLAILSRNLGL